MMNTYNKNTTTLWKFLSKNRIEIPIIQRDYAQGRFGKEELRKKILNSIKGALNPNEKDAKLKLDFIYGSNSGDSLNPLDGQQRLTTLWLLHWYICYMATGKLTDDVKNRLKKFTYETRVSSRTFCENLIDLSRSINPEKKIVQHIEDQTWFDSTWKQDPTIQSMLRMLGGTESSKKTKDGKKVNNGDGIEQIFTENYDLYWEMLTHDNCPIQFYYLDLNGLKLSDDLYIKMNARGEQLSSFENLKADLLGYIREQAKIESSVQSTWKSFLDPKSGFPMLLDNNWTDIFWENKNNECCIDEIYFAFINRFFFNELVVKTPASLKELKGSTIFEYLYGKDPLVKLDSDDNNAKENIDDGKIAYTGIETYKYAIKADENYSYNKDYKDEGAFIPLDSLQSLFNILSHYDAFCKSISDKDKIKDFFESRRDGNDAKNFIPTYNKENIIKNWAGDDIWAVNNITQKERIVFLSICKFFEIKEIDDKDAKDIIDEFKRWMRIVWNIIDNTNIDTIDAMVSILRLINELAQICCSNGSVYLNLSKATHSEDRQASINYNPFIRKNIPEIQSQANRDQIKEEIQKAKQIWDVDHLRIDSNGKNWEEKIIKAEGSLFFSGAIRHLFIDDDWSNFDICLSHALKYFNANGCKENYKVQWIKAFIKNCTDWCEQWVKDTQMFNVSASNLMWFFKSPQYNVPVKNCLSADNLDQMPLLEWSDNSRPFEKEIRNEFIDDNFIEEVNRESPEARIKFLGSDMYLYKSYESDPDKYITLYWGENRKLSILRNLVDNHQITIKNNKEIDGHNLKFWWGKNIEFSYNGHLFRWWGRPNAIEVDIYLLEDNNEWAERNPPVGANSDLEKYYCFRISGEQGSAELLIDGMNKLIDEYSKKK
ncbi:MAG: DUF262 domain-containing protein [Bacteroidales bacterium]|nr:DUF262 domain-containing protein [Bacteroidales bacterium]